MDNPDWQTIAAMKGLPVLFLPETSREAVLLLDQYLRQGEVLLKTGQLQDLQAALDLLQVSLGLQVHDIIQGYSLNAAFSRIPSLSTFIAFILIFLLSTTKIDLKVFYKNVCV